MKKFAEKIVSKSPVGGFLEFIREQGVVGLAIGFILGGAVSKVVTSLVNDIINPLLGIFLGATGSLESASLAIGPIEIMWGSFVSNLINFIIIASIVYFGFKGLRLDKLDRKKEKEKEKKKDEEKDKNKEESK